MANVDGPKGFWPAYHQSGGEIRPRAYRMTASTTIYKGDVLEIIGGGTVDPASAGDGDLVIGVAAEYKVSAASSTSTEVMVYDDPNIIFKCQAANSSSATVAATAVGATCDHIAGAGSATTKLSGHELNVATLNASSAAQQFIIIDRVPTPDNSWGANTKLYVKMNQSHGRGGVAGI